MLAWPLQWVWVCSQHILFSFEVGLTGLRGEHEQLSLRKLTLDRLSLPAGRMQFRLLDSKFGSTSLNFLACNWSEFGSGILIKRYWRQEAAVKFSPWFLNILRPFKVIKVWRSFLTGTCDWSLFLVHDLFSNGTYWCLKVVASKKMHFHRSYSTFSLVSKFGVPYFSIQQK